MGPFARQPGAPRSGLARKPGTRSGQRFVVASAVVGMTIVAGCGQTTPTPTPSPTPVGVIVALGTPVDTSKGSIVVHAFVVPISASTATPFPGDVFAAADVEACGGPHADATTGITPARIHLQVGRYSIPPSATPQRQPALRDSPLPPGRCVRGWVTFELPQGARPAYVVFQGTEVIGWRIP